MGSRSSLRRAVLLGIALSAQFACGSNPVAPSVPSGYSGEWVGTTGQSTPVRFSVSADDQVTSFTITYNFSAACSGTLTYTDLAVQIHALDPPGRLRTINPGSDSAPTVRMARAER